MAFQAPESWGNRQGIQEASEDAEGEICNLIENKSEAKISREDLNKCHEVQTWSLEVSE